MNAWARTAEEGTISGPSRSIGTDIRLVGVRAVPGVGCRDLQGHLLHESYRVAQRTLRLSIRARGNFPNEAAALCTQVPVSRDRLP